MDEATLDSRGASLREAIRALTLIAAPHKIAIVAVMRKLLVTANALVKADRIWVENVLDHNGN
ncbi:MAG: hypothetical protein E5Y83_35355, partial [Mesorhizobium sp.]